MRKSHITEPQPKSRCYKSLLAGACGAAIIIVAFMLVTQCHCPTKDTSISFQTQTKTGDILPDKIGPIQSLIPPKNKAQAFKTQSLNIATNKLKNTTKKQTNPFDNITAKQKQGFFNQACPDPFSINIDKDGDGKGDGTSLGQCFALTNAIIATQNTKLLLDAAKGKPCDVTGVTCMNGSITAIDRSSLKLSGNIPIQQLSELPYIQILKLHNNKLCGDVPAKFIQQIPQIYLGKNNLTFDAQATQILQKKNPAAITSQSPQNCTSNTQENQQASSEKNKKQR